MITKLFVTAALLFAFNKPAVNVQNPFVVNGVIKDKATGAPIQYVHVFTVKGEEESITNEKGEFRFETWQQSAELTTEKEGYQSQSVKLNLPSPKQTILLTKE